MMRLLHCSHTCVCHVTHGMSSIPIVCDCDVPFQYLSIQITQSHLVNNLTKSHEKKRCHLRKELHRVNEHEAWLRLNRVFAGGLGLNM